jgi:hypothetical protein
MFNPAIEADLIDYKAVGALLERGSLKHRVLPLIFRKLLKISAFVKNCICKNWENWQRG